MFSIIMITSYLITAPLITLLHELGHAIPILIFTKNSIEIELGTERGQTKEIVIGRIKFNYKSYSLFTGFSKYSGSTKEIIEILFLIGGPLMSFMIMASVIFYARLPGNPKLLVNAILTGCFWLSGSQFLMIIIPMTYTFGDYNGLTSDRKKLLQLLSKE